LIVSIVWNEKRRRRRRRRRRTVELVHENERDDVVQQSEGA